MKNLRFSLIFIIFSTIIFTGCESDSLNNESANSQEPHRTTLGTTTRLKAKDMEYVGIQHNQFMESMYNLLKEGAVSVSAESIRIEKNYLTNYFLNSSYPDSTKAVCIERINSIEPLIDITNLYPKKATSDYLSPKEKSYLDELYQIISQSKPSTVSQTLDDIADLEDQIYADKSMGNTQLKLLFGATNTARYSFTYWNQNGQDWLALNPNYPVKADGWGDLWGFVKTVTLVDAGGFVGGLAYAAVVNAIPEAGQVVDSAVALGTAAATSASAATVETIITVESWF